LATTAEILYRDFWDVPRMFIVQHDGQRYLFDCKFNQSADEYEDMYQVYALPELTENELDGSWEGLSEKAEVHIGEVLVSSVVFDPTKRRAIDPIIIDEVEDMYG
jgi:hypothetical protein